MLQRCLVCFSISLIFASKANLLCNSCADIYIIMWVIVKSEQFDDKNGACLKRILLRRHISARCLQRQFLGQNAYIMMQVEWFFTKKDKKAS